MVSHQGENEARQGLPPAVEFAAGFVASRRELLPSRRRGGRAELHFHAAGIAAQALAQRLQAAFLGAP